MSKRPLPAWMYQMPDTRNDRIRELEAPLRVASEGWSRNALRSDRLTKEVHRLTARLDDAHNRLAKYVAVKARRKK